MATIRDSGGQRKKEKSGEKEKKKRELERKRKEVIRNEGGNKEGPGGIRLLFFFEKRRDREA